MAPRFLWILLLTKLIGAAVGWAFSPQTALVLFLAPDFSVVYQLLIPSSQQLCRVVRRFATDRREVWLTIDDGPDPDDTPRILDVLDRHGARATFFMIGERAARHPALVAEVLRRGHAIGCHTYSHPVGTFWCAGRGETARQVEAGLAAFGPAASHVRTFRSPVGIKSLFLRGVLRRNQLTCVGWSVRSFDARAPEPERVARRVLRRVRPGDIVLMHEGPGMSAATRVRALEQVVSGLSQRGFVCVLPPTSAWR